MLPFKGLDSFDLQGQLLQSLENLFNYDVFFELDDNQMLKVSHGYFDPRAKYVAERQNLYTLLSRQHQQLDHALCAQWPSLPLVFVGGAKKRGVFFLGQNLQLNVWERYGDCRHRPTNQQLLPSMVQRKCLMPLS